VVVEGEGRAGSGGFLTAVSPPAVEEVGRGQRWVVVGWSGEATGVPPRP
jgi:hypothetical protein